jgi:uncharacterized membrane protein YcaP (DUF421 family)
MLDTIKNLADELLGMSAEELSPGQMAFRAVLTFVVTVVIIRLGNKRLFGKGTAFDLVVSIMIGSVMSRAITNAPALLATWTAGLVLIGMHWLLATLSYHLDWFGPLVKGNPVQLVKDGDVQRDGMREGGVSEADLEQAIRATGSEPDPAGVQLAYLERDGSISVVPRSEGPRVLEVAVADGVQTVRIALE